MDPVLPDVDGNLIIKEMKSIQNVPIFVKSALAIQEEYERKSFNFGCDIYLTKPIFPDMLIAEIGKYLEI